MTKNEALKIAQGLCPYFDEISKGAFYEGFITAIDKLPDATKMMGLIPSEWAGLEEPPNSTTDVVESKPVAWVGEAESGYRDIDWDKEALQRVYPFVYPLYTAPPKQEFVCSTGLCHYKQWVGLTDEEIVKASIGHVEGEHMLPHSFARAIEAKLKEKNRG